MEEWDMKTLKHKTKNTQIILTRSVMISKPYIIFDHELLAALCRSLKEYIFAKNLQHLFMISDGHSRSQIYFGFCISSIYRNDGGCGTILSIETLLCLLYIGHFQTRCKTDYWFFGTQRAEMPYYFVYTACGQNIHSLSNINFSIQGILIYYLK